MNWLADPSSERINKRDRVGSAFKEETVSREHWLVRWFFGSRNRVSARARPCCPTDPIAGPASLWKPCISRFIDLIPAERFAIRWFCPKNEDSQEKCLQNSFHVAPQLSVWMLLVKRINDRNFFRLFFGLDRSPAAYTYQLERFRAGTT